MASNGRTISQDVKIAVSVRDGGKCRQCGSAEELHYDHIIPWSDGGESTVENIQLLCGACNRRKGPHPGRPANSAPTGKMGHRSLAIEPDLWTKFGAAVGTADDVYLTRSRALREWMRFYVGDSDSVPALPRNRGIELLAVRELNRKDEDD